MVRAILGSMANWDAWRIPAIVLACASITGYAVRATLWVGEQEHVNELQDIARQNVDEHLREIIREQEAALERLSDAFNRFKDHGSRFTASDGDGLIKRLEILERKIQVLIDTARSAAIQGSALGEKVESTQRQLNLLREEQKEHRNRDAHSQAEARIQAIQQQLKDLRNGTD